MTTTPNPDPVLRASPACAGNAWRRLAGAASLALLGLCAATAGAEPYRWRDHAAPLDFRFDNSFDTHQQTAIGSNGDLFGFLYVRFTGVRTSDGLPVATHADCNAVSDCRIGWALVGRAARATLLYTPMHDHPVFLVQRVDIPQPGAYAHFHWLRALPAAGQAADGYLLQLAALDRFCFVHHDADAAASSVSCRGNRGVAVRVGLDTATHGNIVTSVPAPM